MVPCPRLGQVHGDPTGSAGTKHIPRGVWHLVLYCPSSSLVGSGADRKIVCAAAAAKPATAATRAAPANNFHLDLVIARFLARLLARFLVSGACCHCHRHRTPIVMPLRSSITYPDRCGETLCNHCAGRSGRSDLMRRWSARFRTAATNPRVKLAAHDAHDAVTARCTAVVT